MLRTDLTEPSQARLSIMRAVQAVLGRPRSIDHLARVLQRELGRVLDTTGFILGLYDDVSQMVEVVRQMEEGVELPGGSFPLGSGFMSDVIRSREPRLIRHWSVEGPRVQVQYATGTPGLPESTVTVPLLVGNRAVGVLSLQSYDVAAYDEGDLFLVQAVAAQAGPAIEQLQRGGIGHSARRASELEAILSSMSDALLVLDREGRIVSLNPPARAIFGPVGSGIVLGQRLDREQWGNWPLGARAVAEALTPALAALERGQTPDDFEVELNLEGRRVLSFSSAPLGDVGGAIVLLRDVTTQRDIAKMKDELVSIASHDLRTPVTVLKAQAQLIQRSLRQGTLEPDRLNDRVVMILEQADRMTRMLTVLLDVSRIEAGRLELSPEPADLVQIVQLVAAGVRALTSKHEIVIEAPQHVTGCWDVARLDQVMQNLLTNAIKYSPAGGEVRVTIGVDRETQTAHISVRDQGVGIPPADLEHVFERFYRVAATSKLEGSGLGLYICQGIVAAHGGGLTVDSPGVGQGTIFTVSLPT